MVIAALAMTVLLLFGALAIDVGFIWASRTQSQNADDAAALAAASSMIDPSVPSVTIDAAEAAAIAVAGRNSTVGNPSVTVTPGGIEFGFWRFAGTAGSCGSDAPPCLDTTVPQNDPSQITGVRVDVLMDDVNNDRAPVFLSQFVGKTGQRVKNTAVAYLGYEGSFAQGEFDLPVAVDSCALSTGGCGDDFCATISNTPNPCRPLATPQDMDDDGSTESTVTCLEFSSTPEQNACWTQYDGDHPSINTPGLNQIVDNGNPNDTQVGDEVYLDNGEKTPVTRRIREKFYGDGPYSGDAHGIDRYSPYDGRQDSWVVKLPVVECQNPGPGCAGGNPIRITGGVCFEIMEVRSPPYEGGDRLIMGRFLCPDSSDAQVRDLWQAECFNPDAPPSTTGGCNFGFRADIPVLVE